MNIDSKVITAVGGLVIISVAGMHYGINSGFGTIALVALAGLCGYTIPYIRK